MLTAAAASSHAKPRGACIDYVTMKVMNSKENIETSAPLCRGRRLSILGVEDTSCRRPPHAPIAAVLQSSAHMSTSSCEMSYRSSAWSAMPSCAAAAPPLASGCGSQGALLSAVEMTWTCHVATQVAATVTNAIHCSSSQRWCAPRGRRAHSARRLCRSGWMRRRLPCSGPSQAAHLASMSARSACTPLMRGQPQHGRWQR